MATTDITHTIICKITGWSIVSGHVEYEIRCERALAKEKWTIKRRYKDFFRLNIQLLPFGLDLNLPPKKTFGNLKAAFIEERKDGLQVFLDKITVHPLLYCCSAVHRFFAENGEDEITGLYKSSLLPLRNYRNYILIKRMPEMGWRYCKMYSLVSHSATKKQQLYSWLNYGNDSCLNPTEINDILLFLKNLHCPYLSESSLTFADQNGIGVIKDHWSTGCLRDQLYKRSPDDNFWEKYGMDNECFILNSTDLRFIIRQILEVLYILHSISYPFVFIHCGNIRITDIGCEISDYEFTLTGQSTFNRPAMIRMKQINSIEDMMVYNFGQLMYEMISGVIVFPDYCADEAIRKLPASYQPLFKSIFLPESKLPSLSELMSHSLFNNVPVARMSQKSIQIPGTVKASLEKLSDQILKRFVADRSTFNEKQNREHFKEMMHSDFEKQRRKELVLAELKNVKF